MTLPTVLETGANLLASIGTAGSGTLVPSSTGSEFYIELYQCSGLTSTYTRTLKANATNVVREATWSHHRQGGCGAADILVEGGLADLDDAVKNEWEVSLKRGGTAATSAWYQGRVVGYRHEVAANGAINTRLFCEGYATKLAGVLVNKDYASQTVAAIVTDVLDTYVTPNTRIGYAAAHVVGAFSVTSLSFKDRSVLDVMSMLASLQGTREWGVSEGNPKPLFYFMTESTTASEQADFSLGDKLRRLTTEGQFSDGWNTVKIIGGWASGGVVTGSNTDATAEAAYGKREKVISESSILAAADANQIAANWVTLYKDGSSRYKAEVYGPASRIEANRTDPTIGLPAGAAMPTGGKATFRGVDGAHVTEPWNEVVYEYKPGCPHRLTAYLQAGFVEETQAHLFARQEGAIASLESQVQMYDHGVLAGLSDDDHSQYLLLAGRSGGQTAYGGTASGDDLYLYSTSNATKGNIFIGGTTVLNISEANQTVAIGTTPSTTQLLTLLRTWTNTSGALYGVELEAYANPGSASSASYYGMSFVQDVTNANAQNIAGTVAGMDCAGLSTGTGTITVLRGMSSYAFLRAAGIASTAQGGYFYVRASAGTVTAGEAIRTLVWNSNASATITTAYGMLQKAPIATGTITTYYHLFMESPTAAGTNYSLWINGGESYFGGQLDIKAATKLALDGTTGADYLIRDGTNQLSFFCNSTARLVLNAANVCATLGFSQNGDVATKINNPNTGASARTYLQVASNTVSTYLITYSSAHASANLATWYVVSGSEMRIWNADNTGLTFYQSNALRASFRAGGLILGTATALGTTAAYVLGLHGGTAPTTQPADMVQLYEADTNGTAGKGGLHIMTEDATSHVLGNWCGIGTIAPGAMLHVHEPTIGGKLLRLTSAATNDDPNVTVFQQRGTTTDATQTIILTFTPSGSQTTVVWAYVVARRTGGSAGTADDGAAYLVMATYKIIAGVATLIGSVATVYSAESQAAWDATLKVSGADVTVAVTGAADNNVTWHVTFWYSFVGS